MMKHFLLHISFSLSLFFTFGIVSVHAAQVGSPDAAAASFAAPSVGGITVAVRGNQLRVTNADGMTLEVYNITGVKVVSHRVEGDDRTLTLNVERGIYIVKVGKVVRRVTIS